MDDLLVAASIATPGLLSLRAMLASRLHPLLALPSAALVSALWSAAIVLIMAVVAGGVIPGSLWALLATAVLSVEAFVARQP